MNESIRKTIRNLTEASDNKAKSIKGLNKLADLLDEASLVAQREAPWGLDKQGPERTYLRDKAKDLHKMAITVRGFVGKVK